MNSLHLLMFAAIAGLPSCASAGRRPAPPGPPPAETAPSRVQAIRAALPQNVRIVVADQNQPVRSGSGVALGSETTAAGPVSYVITNAHVVAARDGERPRYLVLVDPPAGETQEHEARLLAQGVVPDLDLALLEVPGLRLPAARLAGDSEVEVGEDVFVVAAPYGRALSVSAGLVSRIDRGASAPWLPTVLKTDAAIGYGASGGGIFSSNTGRLLGIVEGYRTAKVTIPVGQESFSFDVPMPGETFAAPAPKIRRFLSAKGFERLQATSSDESPVG